MEGGGTRTEPLSHAAALRMRTGARSYVHARGIAWHGMTLRSMAWRSSSPLPSPAGMATLGASRHRLILSLGLLRSVAAAYSAARPFARSSWEVAAALIPEKSSSCRQRGRAREYGSMKYRRRENEVN